MLFDSSNSNYLSRSFGKEIQKHGPIVFGSKKRESIKIIDWFLDSELIQVWRYSITHQMKTGIYRHMMEQMTTLDILQLPPIHSLEI